MDRRSNPPKAAVLVAVAVWDYNCQGRTDVTGGERERLTAANYHGKQKKRRSGANQMGCDDLFRRFWIQLTVSIRSRGRISDAKKTMNKKWFNYLFRGF